MANNDDFMQFLASWALVHESADEGWKAAVTRGREQEPGEMGQGADAFVDGLSALIAERKERLKAELVSGASESGGSRAEVGEHLDELRFEVGELRGRLETMQASLDALLDRSGGARGAGAKPAASGPGGEASVDAVASGASATAPAPAAGGGDAVEPAAVGPASTVEPAVAVDAAGPAAAAE